MEDFNNIVHIYIYIISHTLYIIIHICIYIYILRLCVYIYIYTPIIHITLSITCDMCLLYYSLYAVIQCMCIYIYIYIYAYARVCLCECSCIVLIIHKYLDFVEIYHKITTLYHDIWPSHDVIYDAASDEVLCLHGAGDVALCWAQVARKLLRDQRLGGAEDQRRSPVASVTIWWFNIAMENPL